LQVPKSLGRATTQAALRGPTLHRGADRIGMGGAGPPRPPAPDAAAAHGRHCSSGLRGGGLTHADSRPFAGWRGVRARVVGLGLSLVRQEGPQAPAECLQDLHLQRGRLARQHGCARAMAQHRGGQAAERHAVDVLRRAGVARCQRRRARGACAHTAEEPARHSAEGRVTSRAKRYGVAAALQQSRHRARRHEQHDCVTLAASSAHDRKVAVSHAAALAWQP